MIRYVDFRRVSVKMNHPTHSWGGVEFSENPENLKFQILATPIRYTLFRPLPSLPRPVGRGENLGKFVFDLKTKKLIPNRNGV